MGQVKHVTRCKLGFFKYLSLTTLKLAIIEGLDNNEGQYIW
jgi:hypothetical protein